MVAKSQDDKGLATTAIQPGAEMRPPAVPTVPEDALARVVLLLGELNAALPQ